MDQLERHLSPDIDETSFDMCDPPNPSNPSLSNSISIVNIPDSLPHLKNPLDSSSHDMPTATVDSMDGLPNYDQIRAQEYLSHHLSNISHKDFIEERNQSLKELADTLTRIEDNATKSCPINGSANVLDTNSESYLKDVFIKELKESNEVLLKELKSNNTNMNLMLKRYRELDSKHKQLVEDLKRIEDQSNNSSLQNQCLIEENTRLRDTITELEAKLAMSDKDKSELTREVEVVRSRCHQMANYEKFNVSAELQTQEMTSQIIDSQLKIDSMRAEINQLKKQLTEANDKLESLPALESQVEIYERDFKIEHLAKEAALQENQHLEDQILGLKDKINELEEKLDKGEPVLQLLQQDDPVGKPHKHHRRHRGKLGRNSIPVPSVGAILKGFKQYNNTSNNA